MGRKRPTQYVASENESLSEENSECSGKKYLNKDKKSRKTRNSESDSNKEYESDYVIEHKRHKHKHKKRKRDSKRHEEESNNSGSESYHPDHKQSIECNEAGRRKHHKRSKDKKLRSHEDKESEKQTSKWEKDDNQVRIKTEPVSDNEVENNKELNSLLSKRNIDIKSSPNGQGDNWSKNKASNDQEEKKEKINFGLSGKLADDSNTYNGVVIKYSQPPEARKPKRRWRWYIFKGEEELPFLPLHRQSAYLIGRERKVADIPTDHPSCSKQHAVIQYRLVSYDRLDGTKGRTVKPYIIDLESANGTYVNNRRIDPRKYVELLEKDVVKFGYSSREYVLLHESSKDSDQDLPDTGADMSPFSLLRS